MSDTPPALPATPAPAGAPLLQPLSVHQDSDEIDLGALLGTLIEARWLIAAVTALAVLVGGGYAWLATPQFKVDATVQVEDSSGGGLGASAKDLEGLLQVESQATTEIELLRSRMVLGRVVEQLGLDIVVKPEFFPLIGEALARRHVGSEPAHGMAGTSLGGGYAWGGELLRVTRLQVPAAWEDQPLTLVSEAGNGFRVLDPDGERLGRGVVGQELTLRGGASLFVRELVARPGVAFTLIKRPRLAVISDLQQRLTASEKGKQSGIILLTLTSPQPAQAVAVLNAIANQYVRQNVERKSAEAQQTLQYLETQLPDAKRGLEAAEVRFNAFRSRNNTVDVTKEGELLLQQSVQAETSLAELHGKRKELLQRFTPEHPSVRALDNQIGLMQGERSRFAGKLDSLPQTQQELLRLTRDLQVSQETYTAMLNNAQQLRVVRGGTVGNVRIVDFAEVPLKPVSPKRGLIMMISLLLGLVAGAGLALLRQALKTGVKDASLIESRLGLSVLATIPVSKAQDTLFKQLNKSDGQPRVLAASVSDDLSIESLRSLRTSLHFAQLDASNNVIMISGPSPQVGKSFVSVNLAAVMAAAGQRVLLIDADMRRGYLNEYFGASRDGGLSEVIAGQATPEQAIRASGLEGFDYVATGALPPNPSELLLHPRFEAFLQAMSQRYDQVLIDSPPVMAVTDAAIIGRHAGATLLLARYAHTPLRELEHAARRLQQAGVAVKGVLMNQVAVSTGYGYGYKYAYAYSYGKRKD